MAPRSRIAVIDYQGGNLQSVVKSFDPTRFEAFVTQDPGEFLKVDGLVLPGVGAFADAMRYIDASGQAKTIKEAVSGGTPLLGICLGMQVLFEYGTEGAPSGSPCEGLGLMAGECVKLSNEVAKIPHVGWNTVEYCDDSHGSSPLFKGIPNQSYFYFTHSYCVAPRDRDVVTGVTADTAPMVSSVESGNVFGVQFHPEKSSVRGLALMENFAQIVRTAKESRS